MLFPLGSRASLLLDLPPASLMLPDLVLRLPESLASGDRLTCHLVAIRPEDETEVGGMSITLNVL